MTLAECLAELDAAGIVGDGPCVVEGASLSELAAELNVGGPSIDQKAQYNILRENWTGFLGKGGTNKYPFATDDFRTFQNFVGEWTAESIEDAMLQTRLDIEQSRWNRIRDLMIEQDVKDAAAKGPKAPAATASGPVLKRGAKGDAVEDWQRAIGAPVDGDFGPITEGMTKSIQAQAGLPTTGVVDAATRAAAGKYKAAKPSGGGGGGGGYSAPKAAPAAQYAMPIPDDDEPSFDFGRAAGAAVTTVVVFGVAFGGYLVAKSKGWVK